MNKAIFATVIFSIVMAHGANVHARDLIVGLSPYMEKTASREQVKSVILFLLETVEPGDSARLYDAYHLSSIGTFSVPNKKAYRNPKAKLIVNKKAVKNLLQFAKNAVTPGGENKPSVAGATPGPTGARLWKRSFRKRK